MSIYIDRKYILLLSPKLEHFKQKNTNLFTFRCCFCGDSQKNSIKTRGFVYEKDNNYFFRCHNCELGTTLRNLIKFVDPFLEKEYVMENFKELNSDKKVKISRVPTIPKFKTVKIVEPKLNLPTIASLPDDHVAKKYILGRKLPEYSLNLLYYAEDFKSFVESISDKKLDRTSPRIIIPFFSEEGELIALQGRALDDYSMRYVTVKINREKEKLFGLERLDKKKPVYVVEGPIDSLFIPNSIATADSNLASAVNIIEKNSLVLIPDNEPRNRNIVENVAKFILAGFSVCLFPESVPGKDINEMILSGLTKEEILGIINQYTYTGLRAKLEFIRWKKV